VWMVVAWLAAAGVLPAQLASWGSPLPKRDKPPVVFITGHDAICPAALAGEIPFFTLTFGDFDRVMARDGRVSLVFEACYAPNRPPIEDIAQLLGRLLSQLVYEGGEPVRQVDAVAHSMGGLILRAYLAGKRSDGTWAPPARTGIRKAVFIGTMHFGTHVATSTYADPQVRQMALGSQFLFDLATWNQGTDDLRGIDAIAVAGTAGRNGPATDSVVTVHSAAIDFAARGRTAVFPLCHTQGGIGQLFLCEASPGLTRVADENHPTARLVLDFLNDVPSWARTVAGSADVLSSATGLLVQARTANDAPQPIRSASVTYADGRRVSLAVAESGLAYGDRIPAGAAHVEADGVAVPVTLAAGGSRALVIKPGPVIHAVQPAAGSSGRRVVAPGMLVSISGSSLNVHEAFVDSRAVRLLSVSADRIMAELPENVVEGPAELRVRGAHGQHTVRVLFEPTAPAFFQMGDTVAAVNGASGQAVTRTAPARPHEIVSLFLTGLGRTVARNGLAYAADTPLVRVQGRTCDVVYAGRAPSLPAVDQINCRLPAELQTGDAAVQVSAGGRTTSGLLPVIQE
jgi:uncharacterized protein (TIGR03437 family)